MKDLAGLLNVSGLRAFGALHNLKLDWISFLQCPIAVACDCGVVDKDVGTIVAPDEPISFRIIEPLYGSSHRDPLP